MSAKPPKQTDAEQFAGALIETARDAAKVAAEKIIQPDPKVQTALRHMYELAFMDGVMHVIKNELDDRVAETFNQMNRRERRANMRKVGK